MKTKIVISFLLLTSLSQANEISIDSLGVNLGISNIKAEQIDIAGTLQLTNTPDESYSHGELYILVDGIVEDETIKASINYINSTNSEFKNNLLMIGFNKYYTIKEYNLYAGLLVGIGKLEWQYSPISNNKSKNYKTESVVGALQLGTEYNLNGNIALGLNTKYYISNYSTKVEIGERIIEINHKSSYSLVFGFRYFF